jgi:hypothetical protein
MLTGAMAPATINKDVKLHYTKNLKLLFISLIIIITPIIIAVIVTVLHFIQFYALFVQSQPNAHKNNFPGLYTIFRRYPQKHKTGVSL